MAGIASSSQSPGICRTAGGFAVQLISAADTPASRSSRLVLSLAIPAAWALLDRSLDADVRVSISLLLLPVRGLTVIDWCDFL